MIHRCPERGTGGWRAADWIAGRASTFGSGRVSRTTARRTSTCAADWPADRLTDDGSQFADPELEGYYVLYSERMEALGATVQSREEWAMSL